MFENTVRQITLGGNVQSESPQFKNPDGMLWYSFQTADFESNNTCCTSLKPGKQLSRMFCNVPKRESELQTASLDQYATGACNGIGNLKHNVQNSTSFPPFQGFRKPFLQVILRATKQQQCTTSQFHDLGVESSRKHTDSLFCTL